MARSKARKQPLPGAPFAGTLSEHPRIVAERLRFPHDDSFEIAVIGIEQAVVFGGGKNGGYEEETTFLPLREIITNSRKFRRGCRIDPVSRQSNDFDLFRAHVIGDFSDGQYEIIRRVVSIQGLKRHMD